MTKAATALQTRFPTTHGWLEVLSYWSLDRVAPLRSKDGNEALIVTRLAGDQTNSCKSAERLDGEILGRRGASPWSRRPIRGVSEAVSSRIEKDLSGAESIAMPITLVLLVLVFGGLVAAGLPLIVGVISVLGTFFTLWVITQFTDVSVFSINLVPPSAWAWPSTTRCSSCPATARSCDAGRSIEAAIIRTVETAGRTIAVSATPWPSRCRRCWSSRSTSCAPSPTPASA